MEPQSEFIDPIATATRPLAMAAAIHASVAAAARESSGARADAAVTDAAPAGDPAPPSAVAARPLPNVVRVLPLIKKARFVPYWIPEGVDIGDWSPELRAHVAELINQLYHDHVVMAEPALAQSHGLTLVYLTWLEILEHLRMARAPLNSRARRQLIKRYLRLVDAKQHVSHFLLRLERFKQSCPEHFRDERRRGYTEVRGDSYLCCGHFELRD